MGKLVFVHFIKTLPYNKGVFRIRRLKLLIVAIFSLVMTSMVYAQGGRIDIEILGHYTDDKESWGEEWTFEVQTRDVPNLDEKDWRPENSVKNKWSGDSDPNNNDWHDLEDKRLLRHIYSEALPRSIEVRQRGWENDRGARIIFDCCNWYTNDDDDYGTGTETIDVNTLVHEAWSEFDWPNLDGDHGIRVRAKVIHAPVIKDISPNFGCRGDTNLQVTITGGNFPSLDENLLASIVWEGLVASNFHVVSSSEITARVDIGPQACLGFADVRVGNRELIGLQDGQLVSLQAVMLDAFEIKRATDPSCNN